MNDPQHPPRPDFTKTSDASSPPPSWPHQPAADPSGPPPSSWARDGGGAPGQDRPGPVPFARPAMSPQDERTWGMLAHLLSIGAGLIGVPFLGPLIVFLVLKDRSVFVREHAAESLNMNISLIVYSFVLGVVFSVIALATFGIGLTLFVPLSLLPVAALVFTILAAVAAYGGRPYRYPLIFRLVH